MGTSTSGLETTEDALERIAHERTKKEPLVPDKPPRRLTRVRICPWITAGAWKIHMANEGKPLP